MCYHAHKGPVRFILPVNPIRRLITSEQPLETPPRDEEVPTPMELLPPPPGPHAARNSTEALPDVSTSYEGIGASHESLGSHGRMVGGVGEDIGALAIVKKLRKYPTF